ncbi:MAG: hypothetical protein AB8G16_15915 [Gammaproteobacteria bacterium]
MARFVIVFGLTMSAAVATDAFAASFTYSGNIATCFAACDEFFVLSNGSGSGDFTRVNLWQPLPLSSDLDLTLPADSVGDFRLSLRRIFVPTTDPVLGPSDQCPPPNVDLQLCNLNAVNPLIIANEVGTIAGSGMAMADGSFSSGQVSIALTQEPFARNDTRFTIDLVTGDATLTLIDGAVVLATFEGAASLTFDSDGDGIDDLQDNCTYSANASQYDSNGDGFGNACDGDVNDDCIVNGVDLAVFRLNYFTPFPDIDFNGDGIPGIIDLGLLRTFFFQPPGPSGIASCESAAAR